MISRELRLVWQRQRTLCAFVLHSQKKKPLLKRKKSRKLEGPKGAREVRGFKASAPSPHSAQRKALWSAQKLEEKVWISAGGGFRGKPATPLPLRSSGVCPWKLAYVSLRDLQAIGPPKGPPARVGDGVSANALTHCPERQSGSSCRGNPGPGTRVPNGTYPGFPLGRKREAFSWPPTSLPTHIYIL